MRLLFVLLLLGCVSVKAPTVKFDDPRIAKLREKRDLYLSLSQQNLDSYGLVPPTGDSALFSCLFKLAGGKVNWRQILDNGVPFRHPSIKNGDSVSPWSRDMSVGLFWCFASEGQKSLPDFKKFLEWAKFNAWDLCGPAEKFNVSPEDRIGRCQTSPQLIGSFYSLYSYLGGECDSSCVWAKSAYKIWPFVKSHSREDYLELFKEPITDSKEFVQGLTGYQKHLFFIHNLGRGLTEGALSSFTLDAMEAMVKQQPRNALFQAIFHKFSTGDQSITLDLLLNDPLFPNKRLPTSQDYCTHYLYQRDEIRPNKYRTSKSGCVEFNDPKTQFPTKKCGLPKGQRVQVLEYNPDYLSCSRKPKYGPKVLSDWLLAAKLVFGERLIK